MIQHFPDFISFHSVSLRFHLPKLNYWIKVKWVINWTALCHPSTLSYDKNKSAFICTLILEPKTITKMCVAYRKINSHLWCRIEMKHTFFPQSDKWPWNDTFLPYAKVFVTENLLINSLSIKFPVQIEWIVVVIVIL